MIKAQFKEFTADRAFDCAQCKEVVEASDIAYWDTAVTNKGGSNRRVCSQCAESISNQAIVVELGPKSLQAIQQTESLDKLLKRIEALEKWRGEWESV